MNTISNDPRCPSEYGQKLHDSFGGLDPAMATFRNGITMEELIRLETISKGPLSRRTIASIARRFPPPEEQRMLKWSDLGDQK